MKSPRHRTWSYLLSLARWTEAPVILAGQLISWLILPLIVVIIFDAITRKFIRQLAIVIDNDIHHYLNSPAIQDAEWHMHTMIFLVALGFAYSRNAHVRLDIVRPRMGARVRLWVELVGGLLLLLPFAVILSYYGWDVFESAWIRNERSGEANGIDNRWFIKFFLFLGPVLLFLSGLSMVIRIFVRLFGPPEFASETDTDRLTRSDFTAFDQ